MFSPKIKIKRHLMERIKKYSRVSGYSSVEEFVEHTLEKELTKPEGASSEEEIKKRLKGLGYIS